MHADELLSPDGHAFDKLALEGLLNDREVKEWIAKMTQVGLLVQKR